MRFLGMAGYYRKFCSNFSTISSPLTNLLKKNINFFWSQSCQEAFDKLKAILKSEPVLAAPDFLKPLKLAVRLVMWEQEAFSYKKIRVG